MKPISIKLYPMSIILVFRSLGWYPSSALIYNRTKIIWKGRLLSKATTPSKADYVSSDCLSSERRKGLWVIKVLFTYSIESCRTHGRRNLTPASYPEQFALSELQGEPWNPARNFPTNLTGDVTSEIAEDDSERG